MSFWDEKEPKGLFQELPFYNTFIEKPSIKRLENIDLMHELPFYDEFSIEKISKASKRYAKRCRIEIINPKDPLAQLETSKSSIKDLFKDLLDENKVVIKTFLAKVTLKNWLEEIFVTDCVLATTNPCTYKIKEVNVEKKSYYPETCNHFRDKIKVVLDLLNFATKKRIRTCFRC